MGQIQSYLYSYLFLGVEAENDVEQIIHCEECHVGLAEADPGAFCNRCSNMICADCVHACKQCSEEGQVKNRHFTPMCGNCSNDCSWHKTCQETIPLTL